MVLSEVLRHVQSEDAQKTIALMDAKIKRLQGIILRSQPQEELNMRTIQSLEQVLLLKHACRGSCRLGTVVLLLYAEQMMSEYQHSQAAPPSVRDISTHQHPAACCTLCAGVGAGAGRVWGCFQQGGHLLAQAAQSR